MLRVQYPSISKKYPAVGDDGAYDIAQNIIQTGDAYSEKDFDELWEGSGINYSQRMAKQTIRAKVCYDIYGD